MNRRVATDADLKVGSIVFKGNGKAAQKVWRVNPGNENRATYYALQSVTSKSAPGGRYYTADELQVETTGETGIDTLRDLLSFD